jgi:hypothetical protein
MAIVPVQDATLFRLGPHGADNPCSGRLEPVEGLDRSAGATGRMNRKHALSSLTRLATNRSRRNLSRNAYYPERHESIAAGEFTLRRRPRVKQPAASPFDRERRQDAATVGTGVDPDAVWQQFGLR